MQIDFRKQTVLITGASNGIGKVLYKSYKKLGANVIGTYNKKKIKGLIPLDFDDEKSITNFFEKIKNVNKIDVLINNAGINKINAINNLNEDDAKSILNINTIGPMLLTKEISKKMIKNRYGKLINISSIFGLVSKEKRVVYSMSKFGLNGLTKGSAIDLAKFNILVNSVSPGFVITKLTMRVLGAEISKIKKKIPIKRLAKPEEIANLVLFLSSKKNTYICGENIFIDGGFTSV